MRVPDQLEPESASALDSLAAGTKDIELRLMELRHRSKNMLSIATAIVNQTLQGAITLDEAREVLTARLAAMGSAFDLLVGKELEVASFRDLAQGTLGHFGHAAARIIMAGTELVVGPNAALHLALALHELGTNALKYGALSTQTGTVHLNWGASPANGELIELEWTEVGGPAVAAPARTGFGSRLTSSLVPRRLRGQATISYPREGLCWRMTAPVKALTQ